MRRNGYDSYHGRSRVRTFLKVLIVLLLVVLAVAVGALLWLEPYIDYSANGIKINLPFFQQKEGAVLQKHRLFVAASVFAGGDLLLPPAAGARGGTAAPGGGGRAGAGCRLFAAAEEPGGHHRRQRKSRGAFCNGVFFHVVLLPFHPNAGYGSSIAAPA